MEVQAILKASHIRVEKLLRRNKSLLDKLAKKLVDQEVMGAKEIKELLNLE
jgi:ATP-dependent Zn protease